LPRQDPDDLRIRELRRLHRSSRCGDGIWQILHAVQAQETDAIKHEANGDDRNGLRACRHGTPQPEPGRDGKGPKG
jgi:hypothetical protein